MPDYSSFSTLNPRTFSGPDALRDFLKLTYSGLGDGKLHTVWQTGHDSFPSEWAAAVEVAWLPMTDLEPRRRRAKLVESFLTKLGEAAPTRHPYELFYGFSQEMSSAFQSALPDFDALTAAGARRWLVNARVLAEARSVTKPGQLHAIVRRGPTGVTSDLGLAALESSLGSLTPPDGLNWVREHGVPPDYALALLSRRAAPDEVIRFHVSSAPLEYALTMLG